MNKEPKTGKVSAPASKRQWQLYQQLAGFSKELNRAQDAREATRDRLRSAPADMLPIVF